MELFEQSYKSEPGIPNDDIVKLASKLIDEEVAETLEAIEYNNLIGIADGIADSIYVLLWAANAYGIDIDAVFNEVHNSNMSKMWEDG